MKDSVNTRFLDLQKVAETMTKARKTLLVNLIDRLR